MSDANNLPDGPNDAELISRVRGGDVAAYGTLFERHVDAATRLARQLVASGDADDLVSEAFVKVLNVLLGGGGPDIAFRAYLLTAVRRLHIDKIRATQKATPTDDLTPFDPGVPFQDTAVAGFEGGAAAKAFASLPERWQLVLWHLEVEGQKPADIAPLLGMSANSVSALGYRAREGLRQAFLNMHINDLVEEDCRWTHDKLGAYVRDGLSRRDNTKVREHLDGCRKCTAIYLELSQVNSGLAALLGPLLLGGAAAGYLGVTSGATGAVGGVVLLFDRAKDFILANAQASLAVGAAAGIAAVATTGLVIANSEHKGDLAVSDPAKPGVTSSAPQTPATGLPNSPAKKKPARKAKPPAVTPRATTQVTPAATPSATPKALTATGQPKPAKKPRHEPPKTTSPITPPPVTPPAPGDPSPEPPATDVSVTASGRGGLGSRITATVAHIPAGVTVSMRVTVRVTGVALSLRGAPRDCTRVRRIPSLSFDCQMTPESPTLSYRYFGVLGHAIWHFEVTPPEGYSGDDPGNNSDTEDLPGLVARRGNTQPSANPAASDPRVSDAPVEPTDPAAGSRTP